MAKIMTPAMEKLQSKKVKHPRKSGPWHEAWYRLRRNKAAIVGLIILAILVIFALFPQAFARYGEDEQIYEDAFIFPNWEHPMGTDNYGRDILSRCIYGARTSLMIGTMAVVMSIVIGGICGLTAAYYGGKTDDIIMRIMDVFYALPSFLLAICIASALGSGLLNLALAIAISQVPGLCTRCPCSGTDNPEPRIYGGNSCDWRQPNAANASPYVAECNCPYYCGGYLGDGGRHHFWCRTEFYWNWSAASYR